MRKVSKYFPTFGLNTGKCGPEKTPYLESFHAVYNILHYIYIKYFTYILHIYVNLHSIQSFNNYSVFNNLLTHYIFEIKKGLMIYIYLYFKF